jgi:hypothetical protein
MIVKELPIENARDLLVSCKKIHDDGQYAFTEKCFHTILVSLSQKNLCKVDDILDNESCRFLQRIFIRLDQQDNLVALPLPTQLASILTKGLRASTKCKTIVIYDDPRRTSRIFRIMLANVAEQKFNEEWLGLAPKTARIGDRVAVLSGGRVPYILRN